MKSPTYSAHKHSGIIMDLPPEEVPEGNWTSGSNVQFQDFATTRVGGYSRFAGTPTNPPIFALNALLGAESYWIYCSADHVYVTDGTTHWDITPAGGLQTVEVGSWTGCTLNGIPVLNNGKNAPFSWDFNTGSRCTYLPGWPVGAYCKAIRAFKYHLFALNIFNGTTAYGNSLWWSNGAEPGALPTSWSPTPDNDAGDMILSDTQGDIVDGLSLRDIFVVYKAFTTYALSYVAGQYVYTQRKLFLTTGIQSSNCVTEINGEHWVFTGTDLIRHDGQNFKSVLTNKVKTTLVNSIDSGKISWVCVTSRHRNNQIWVSIPTDGQPYLNKAYVVNIITEDIGIRELPLVAYVARGIVNIGQEDVSWEADDQPWDSDITFWDQANYSPTEDSILMCDQDSNALWDADYTDDNDGSAVDAFVERQSMPVGDNILRAMITRVVPRLDGEPGETVNIRVGGQAYFGQPISWSDPLPFVIGQDVGVDCQVEGRLMSIRFEGSTMRKWKVHSYKIGFVDLGMY
jgi:hypothetical protein